MAKKRGGKKGSMPGTIDTTEQDKATPKSIIIYRGDVGNNVRALMHEWRNVFLPWSSKKLHGENKSLKDFLAIASTFSVSHLQLFTAPSHGTSLRLMRFSNGPTLTFRVEAFTLCDDITVNQKRPISVDHEAFSVAPVVILNNFNLPSNPPEVSLLEATFRSMFPSVNIQLMKPNDIHRVVMFHYDPESRLIEARHYYINAKAVGLSKTVKKLMEGRLPSKMGTIDSVDEVLDREGAWSDTDGEGEEVPLARPFRQHKDQCRLKLVEIGPRMTLQLMKVENGFAGGEVIFHSHVAKSAREVALNASKVRSKKAEKAKRKAVQDQNVKKKLDRRQEKIAKKQERRAVAEQRQRSNPFEVEGGGGGGANYDADDE
jgi:ribosome biogenesis protein SSF1/2